MLAFNLANSLATRARGVPLPGCICVVSTVGKCLQSPGKQLGYVCDLGANNAINVVYIILVTIITT